MRTNVVILTLSLLIGICLSIAFVIGIVEWNSSITHKQKVSTDLISKFIDQHPDCDIFNGTLSNFDMICDATCQCFQDGDVTGIDCYILNVTICYQNATTHIEVSFEQCYNVDTKQFIVHQTVDDSPGFLLVVVIVTPMLSCLVCICLCLLVLILPEKRVEYTELNQTDL